MRKIWGTWERTYYNKGKSSPAPKKSIQRRISAVLVVLLAFMIFVSFAFGFSIAVFSRFMLFQALLTLMPGEIFLGETNILVLGLDAGVGGHRSDTIMVVNINPKNSRASIISIPRDTLVTIPGRGLDKVNHAFAYGGVELSKKTIENFLGVNIPYYVVLDVNGLADLIDRLGGVYLDVEKRMYYVDYAQGLYVDLYPGYQKLSGRDVLSYLRYRSDGGDITRISRQQKFISAVTTQILNKENIFRSPQIALSFLSFLETNLSLREIFGLSQGIKKIYELGEIKMTSLSGTDAIIDGIYYLKPDIYQIQEFVKIFFNRTG
jgi:LCP family protein required for cell wall assembly